MALSYLGIYFRNCKAMITNHDTLFVKCQLANMAIKNSTPLARWKSSVSIILDK